MTLTPPTARGSTDSPLLTFRGVRGSMPVSGPATERYGGRTLCVDIETGDTSAVIFDAGTGIATLSYQAPETSDYHIFLTHYHWDHIQGLLFFPPLYEPTNTFTLYGRDWSDQSIAECLNRALRPPWFPIALTDTPAQKRYVSLGGEAQPVAGLTITSAPLQHPQGVTAYRIDGPSRSVVIATDCERGEPVADDALRSLARDADILVHDAQYTPEEYAAHYRGWGHSTWAHAAEAATENGVDELILISHAPTRADHEVDDIVASAQTIFANTRAAFEGMQIAL